MRSCSRKKLLEEEVHGNLLLRGEIGGGSGRSIFNRDIHLSSIGRKYT